MGSFDIYMRCTVLKALYCEGGTEEEVRKDPWKYCVAEHEVDMMDWEMEEIEPHEYDPSEE